MKAVYVAGPFRGPNSWEIEENIRRAERLALEVWRMGAAALCPHTNTRFFQGAADDSVWLDGDLELLARCDAVVMTDDWERSTGAKAEERFAVERGIPVFYNLLALREWLSGRMCDVCAAPIPSDDAIAVCGRCLAP
jgi:nucleoside 2-deoxyribosyltransferase